MAGTALVLYDPPTEPRATLRQHGRPTLYTPDRIQAIYTALENNMPRMRAAALAGIDYETFRDWIVKKVDFSVGVARAEAIGQQKLVKSMNDAATGENGTQRDWRAAESLAKRRYPAEFGDTLDVRSMSVVQLKELYEIMVDRITPDTQPAIEDSFDVL